eukprot:6024926-Amphidinium_carterae.1
MLITTALTWRVRARQGLRILASHCMMQRVEEPQCDDSKQRGAAGVFTAVVPHIPLGLFSIDAFEAIRL